MTLRTAPAHFSCSRTTGPCCTTRSGWPDAHLRCRHVAAGQRPAPRVGSAECHRPRAVLAQQPCFHAQSTCLPSLAARKRPKRLGAQGERRTRRAACRRQHLVDEVGDDERDHERQRSAPTPCRETPRATPRSTDPAPKNTSAEDRDHDETRGRTTTSGAATAAGASTTRSRRWTRVPARGCIPRPARSWRCTRRGSARRL